MKISKKASLYIRVGLSCWLCLGMSPWNNPYSFKEASWATLYKAFSEEAKHLDPALSYAANEWLILNQIYEPPLQYHPTKRPYTLEPLVAQNMPTITFKDHKTIYHIKIKPGIYYHRHPAFSNYPKSTREVEAKDFIYQIQRLLNPSINSPILELMKDKIVKAVTVSKYEYQIHIKGQYPQFIYWLAMPFFAPMPWEAVEFYNKTLLKNKNIDTSPVGTGPFWLSENNPNRKIVLSKNKHYHDKGPFLDEVVFTLEKESLPYWNKFLQGYYDQSGISSDSFDQALQGGNAQSGLELTSELKDKKIQLNTAVLPHIFYWGFNMLDETVGGYSDKKRKLRQAISIAMDIEEYIELFMNGRAKSAQGPLPEGVFGFLEGSQGINKTLYDEELGHLKRKSLTIAKQWLSEAGYPNGIDPKTKVPLILYLDTTMGGGDTNAIFSWTRKQFQKLNIELVIRSTSYNRFQEKVRTGNTQIFSWGWNADYPDPENFLFLLYGPNGKVKHYGENATNYHNEKYDMLFEVMRTLPNNALRQKVINDMVDILRNDAPWIWGYHPFLYTLSHQWVKAPSVSAFGQNSFKYIQIDPLLRKKEQKAWNQPKIWPLGFMGLILIILLLPIFLEYKRKMYKKGPP